MSDLTTSRSLYRNSGASLLLAVGLILPLRAPAQSTATFADSQLDNAVRLALNKPTGALTTSDLIGLTNLTAKSAGINTLSGLESATNLLSLNLNGNYLTNLATLSTLTALTNLDVSSNLLANINPLTNLANLLLLDVRTNLLDLTAGSEADIAVQAIASQGTTVLRSPQAPEIPTLTITSGPPDNARLTNSTVDLAGTASDDVFVVAVEWQLINSNGTNDWQPATGATNWSFSVTNLAIGSNVFRVRARDNDGFFSPEITRSYVLLTPITITLDGCGTLVPNDVGTTFKEVGVSYTLTAKPCAGQAFVNWTGSISNNDPGLTFTMQTGLVLVAHFVPRDYSPFKATYNGLFYETNQVVADRSGSFTLRTTPTGKFTAALRLGNHRFSARGEFDIAGHATVTTGRSGAAFTLDLQMDTAADANWLVGTISSADWGAQLTAVRADSSSSFATAYTLDIPGNFPEPDQPGGDGYALLSVSKKGNAHFRSRLSDGTRATASGSLSRDGMWPLYQSLYAGKGAVLGWLQFTNGADDDLHGDINWIKPPSRKKPYPNGFNVVSPAYGSKYARPRGNEKVLDMADGVLTLYDLGLVGITNRISVVSAVRVSNFEDKRFLGRLVVGTGYFHGRVLNPATNKRISFEGVALQRQNVARGFFLDGAQSGAVSMDETFSLKGGFTGLFFDPEHLSPESSGSISLTTQHNGTFTGTIRMGNSRYSLKGHFNSAAQAEVIVNRSGLSKLKVALQFDSSGKQVTGTVTDGVWQAVVVAQTSSFDGKKNLAPQAGKYTMAIAGVPGDPTLPAGDGYATVTVATDGGVKFAATLADGTKISQSSSVSDAGQWPIFIAFSGNKGSLLGWMNFASTPVSDFSGDLLWTKTAVASNKFYPNGFAMDTTASGSLLASGNGLSFSNGVAIFYGGNLATGITNLITLQSGNVRNVSSNNLTVKLLSSGLFNGMVVDPASSKTISFNGAVVHKAETASGFFLGTTQSGRVLIQGR